MEQSGVLFLLSRLTAAFVGVLDGHTKASASGNPVGLTFMVRVEDDVAGGASQ